MNGFRQREKRDRRGRGTGSRCFGGNAGGGIHPGHLSQGPLRHEILSGMPRGLPGGNLSPFFLVIPDFFLLFVIPERFLRLQEETAKNGQKGQKKDLRFRKSLNLNGAEGGTRTLMPLLAPDFESSASAISPLRPKPLRFPDKISPKEEKSREMAMFFLFLIPAWGHRSFLTDG